MKQLTIIETEVLKIKLKDFQSAPFFSICTLRDICNLVGNPSVLIKELQPVHCVHWKDMSPELLAEVSRILVLLLGKHSDRLVIEVSHV